MRYKWIENIEDFKKIREEWDDSLIKSDSPNPFLLSDFIISWWKWFGTGCMLRILIVFDNDVITGGLPLYLKKGRFFKILKHIGDFAANYTEPFYLKKKNSFFYTLKDAFSARNDWDVLCLTDVREGNKMISEYTVSALRQKFTVKILKDHYNWAVDLSEGFEVYMKTLSKRLKRYLKSNTNCIEEKYGNMELKKIKGKDNIERYFDTYNRFSIDSFSRRNRNSNFTDPDYSDFFREFLVLMDNKDRLDAHVLTAGDNTLAVSFSYRFGKGLNWALTSFNYPFEWMTARFTRSFRGGASGRPLLRSGRDRRANVRLRRRPAGP